MVDQVLPAFHFPLWDDQVPLALGKSENDRPSLEIYRPPESERLAPTLIIFPGGGYNHHANHEGQGYAQWFTSLGLVCAVVKYRLGSQGYRHPTMLLDAARSVRLLRSKAKTLRVDPLRVGIIGSSAGGHLSAMLITQDEIPYLDASDPVDHFSSMPDFCILCYPVISMQKYPHQGSRNFLLGENPTLELLNETSPERHVFIKTPPCFIWHTVEDPKVNVNHSLLFASSLQSARIPFELHIYQQGDHGLGLANGHPWTDECQRWLRENRFIDS